jgi:peptidoglycan hydrolase-like protein with peptidoglycan-binding domain
MSLSTARSVLAIAFAFVLSGISPSLLAQNQAPAKPQAPARPGAQGNQSGTTPTNQAATKPTEPALVPGAPLYISPGIVRLIQERLIAEGYPMPATSGAWGDNSAAGLAEYQRKKGLDPGGDLDELTLTALGMPEVLRGEVPPGGDAPVSASAAASGGAPLAASPRLTRVIQHQLTQAGFPTHNVFGIWIREIDNAARNFQKAKGLEITNTLDLQLIHALGLLDALTNPQPGKLPSDSVVQILSGETVLMTGTPITVSGFGIRQVQQALVQRGQKAVVVDGKWSDATSAALKAFQEEQKLEPTGLLNLRTLRALGFANPLAELDRPTGATGKKPPSVE